MAFPYMPENAQYPFPFPPDVSGPVTRSYARGGLQKMNEPEINQILGALTGNWPHPPMNEGERQVWRRTLAAFHHRKAFTAAIDAIDAEILLGTRSRPRPPELIADMRERLGLGVGHEYKQPPGPFLHEQRGRLTPPEEYPRRVAEIRKALLEARVDDHEGGHF